MVILGTILGVILGGASGLVSGFVAAVLAAAILVPYKGKQTTVTIAFGVAAVIAAAVTVWLLTGLDPDDAQTTMLTVCRPTHRRDEPMARVRVHITSRGTHGVAVGDDYVRRS